MILRIFNVPAEHFRTEDTPEDFGLQNALARLGAVHLQPSEQTIASERLSELNNVVADALVSGTPRLVTALGPVLVCNADSVTSLRRIHWKLGEIGMEHRLGWLVENVLAAIASEITKPLETAWLKRYRRTTVVLQEYLARVAHDQVNEGVAPDVLDGSIRSAATLTQLRESSSEISRLWNIVTPLQPEDFTRALRAARDGV